MRIINPEQHLALNNFIMKKINVQLILLIGLIVNFISCKAQTLPLNTFMEEIPSNAYVKDLNNELPPYLGIYKAIYDGKEVTLYITKEDNKLTKVMNKHFYQDALVVKYIVKNLSGLILQDTYNLSNPKIEIVSMGTDPMQNIVELFYTGTHCNVGWGTIYLKKINSTQISWEYRPNSILTDDCPPGTDKKVYLPVTKDLIFTKQ